MPAPMSAANLPSRSRDTRKALSRRAFTGLLAGGVGAALFFLRRALRDVDEEDGPGGPSTVAGARPLPLYRPPELHDGRTSLSFLALGDVGWPGPARDGVVAAMNRAAAALPFSFVCLLGDNFYENGRDGDGVRSSDDPRWQTGFEQVFAGARLEVPFYSALGNHDHNGNPEAQVEYTERGTRWHMPESYYSFVVPAGAGCEAQFFVLDTEAIRRKERESTEQLRWLEDKLARSQAGWKIVIGHHPVRSNGEHGRITRVADALEPLFERHGVALYLSGHDHDLEALETGRGFLQVVSGAGSSTRDMRWRDDTRFASAAPGFAWVGIEGEVLQLVFVDAERGPLRCLRYELSELVPSAAARG